MNLSARYICLAISLISVKQFSVHGVPLQVPHINGIDDLDGKGRNYIYYSVIKDDLESVKGLLLIGSDMKQRYANDYYRTLLHYAAIQGSDRVLKYFLENGFDVNVQEDDHWTPLHEAAAAGNLSTVKILIEHGANINQLANNSQSPMYVAHKHNKTEVENYFRSIGASRRS